MPDVWIIFNESAEARNFPASAFWQAVDVFRHLLLAAFPDPGLRGLIGSPALLR